MTKTEALIPDKQRVEYVLPVVRILCFEFPWVFGSFVIHRFGREPGRYDECGIGRHAGLVTKFSRAGRFFIASQWALGRMPV